MLQRVYPNTKPILTYTYLNLSGPVQGPLLSHSFPLLPKQLPSEDVEKKEPLYTVGGNVNCYSHYGEQYGGSLKN